MTREGAEPSRRPRRPLTREGAWEYLLRVLARQSYTVAELRRKLVLRDVPDTTAEELLLRLQELRLVDDATYTEQYVASRKDSRGRLALGQELRRKGIDDELAARHIATLTPAQQSKAALTLLEKHAWRYRPATEPAASEEALAANEFEARTRLLKARAKALAFLARRGFSADVAAAATDDTGWFRNE